ncbi:MAG TPA: cephalosporin hydroxylase family protein [Smithella sp.]|jgi:cephalosporin hydroxylase|nr:cephalosporin hydroxylase family protein [Desulfobacterales bacterium]HNY51473.1 cephalosporin hydroxylase family protein [Smithella sp.]HOC60347.1 cephalosporin hydroxylase family protein [Smithellaceae bacterium]HOG91559.1 cephalosporin hydroxylase family protein [Smithella sp.]
MDPIQQFKKERRDDIARMAEDEALKKSSLDWMIASDKYKYSYNYTWLGRPIIKYPNDIVATQEIIWSVKPDLIIETGIAHGGSLMLSASILEIIGGDGIVLGIDIDIREHNLKEILNHPMSRRIQMIEGSSVSKDTIEQVRLIAQDKKKVMVFLDSLHSHAHVAAELKLYASLVSLGSYLVLPDTFIEYFPKGYFSKDRPWDVGDNPMTALREFLANNNQFEIDRNLCNKLMITEAFDGYLKRVR